MKKIILYSMILSVILLTSTFPVSALTEAPTGTGKLREVKKEVRQDIKEIRKIIKNRVGKIVNGQVTVINGNTLTVTNNGKTYTVNTDEKTQFKRHFWGKSSLSEIVVGNNVTIYGAFTDDAQTTIQARLVRNLSIQKRFGAFLGNIISKSEDSFVIKSVNRGDQTVVKTSSTKFVGRNETPLTFADLQVGRRVRVKGVWDKTLNKITEVLQVKDYSLPLHKTSPTPSAQQ